MEEYTEAQSTAPTTDESTVNQIAEELHAQEQIEQPVTEDVAPVIEEQQVVEQPQSRSERRETNYIDKLSQEIRNSGFRSSDRPELPAQDYQPLKYEEGDYDPRQLEQDRERYGEAQRQSAYQEYRKSQEAIQNQLWADRLEMDNERAQKAWDILDESSDKFDSDFSAEMTQKYLNFIGYRATTDQQGNTVDIKVDRPNIRWIDFVKAEKQNFERYVARQAETSVKNVAKQAANTGIRPSGQSRTSTHRDVDFSDPNWISKLTKEEYDSWGRELSDKWLNERLGIK